MSTSLQHVIRQIDELRGDNRYGGAALEDVQHWTDAVGAAIHVAVMVEPYLTKVVQGDKYIESRLTRVNIAPFLRASVGDIILFKRSGGPITAIAEVSRVQFVTIGSTQELFRLVADNAAGLSYEEDYAASKAAARYASLMWLRNVSVIADLPLAKQSRQAWLTFMPKAQRMATTPDIPLF